MPFYQCAQEIHLGSGGLFWSALTDVLFFLKRVFIVSPLRKALIDTTVMSVLTQLSCSSSNNTSALAIYSCNLSQLVLCECPRMPMCLCVCPHRESVCVCVCVRARECVRVYAQACVHACHPCALDSCSCKMMSFLIQ